MSIFTMTVYNTRMKGIFIVLEGGDFTGKSTQIKKLAEHLRERGLEVVVTKEPGGTPEGQKIRERLLHEDLKPEEELELFFKDRRILVEEVLRPELTKGKVIISDRSGESTIAYQGGGRGLDRRRIKEQNREIYGDVKPDKIILFDGVPGALRGRAIARGEKLTRFDKLELDFHQRVRESFLEQARENPNMWCVINALRSIEHVFQEVKACVEPLLEKTQFS